MGAVGLDWRIEGFGDFSGRPGETDMLMRNVNFGELLLYDIANNQITGANFLGPFGPDWQFRRRRSDPSSRHLRSRVAQRQQRLSPGLQYRRQSDHGWIGSSAASLRRDRRVAQPRREYQARVERGGADGDSGIE